MLQQSRDDTIKQKSNVNLQINDYTQTEELSRNSQHPENTGPLASVFNVNLKMPVGKKKDGFIMSVRWRKWGLKTSQSHNVFSFLPASLSS